MTTSLSFLSKASQIANLSFTEVVSARKRRNNSLKITRRDISLAERALAASTMSNMSVTGASSLGVARTLCTSIDFPVVNFPKGWAGPAFASFLTACGSRFNGFQGFGVCLDTTFCPVCR